jgi:hypothetical protein
MPNVPKLKLWDFLPIHIPTYYEPIGGPYCMAEISLITGKRKQSEAWIMREFSVNCGPEGRLFEPLDT